jgi:hypothetical protein
MFLQVGGVEGGGFDDANNVGAVTGSQWSPSPWSLLRFVDRSTCIEAGGGLCPMGDLRSPPNAPWGTLGMSPFDNPNINPIGEASISFGVMTTGNFSATNNDGQQVDVKVTESGIQFTFQLPGPTAGVFLDFRIDAAFGSGQKNTGPGHNDFAVVEFVVDNQTVEALRWSRDDLQPGGQGTTTARNRKDCGTATLGSTQNYPLCTDWERHFLAVEKYAGKIVTVNIRIVQPLPDNEVASFLAVDNVAFNEYDFKPVVIDVLPGKNPNVIKLLDGGTDEVIRVALFGSTTLSVRDVDRKTLRIGDVFALRGNGGNVLATFTDRNGDGYEDVIVQFDRAQLVDKGLLTSQTSSLELIGILPDRTRVRGSDDVVVIGLPVARAGGPYTGTEGTLIALDGSLTTETDALEKLVYSWDFGDGRTAQGKKVSHKYVDNGTYQVKLNVKYYSNGAENESTTTATVSNVVPNLQSIDVPADPIELGERLVIYATFTDRGSADTHTLLVDWGDGTASAFDTDMEIAKHTYGKPGLYTVTVRVQDDDGGISRALSQIVSVYEPN